MIQPEHDPLTCAKCDPEPKAQFTLTTGQRVTRYTGVGALLIMFGPLLMIGFILGFLAAIAIT